MGSQRSRAITTASSSVPPPQTWQHLPLGMSRFPDVEDLESERDNASSPGFLSSIAGTIRSRTRSVLPGHPDFHPQSNIDGRIPNSPPQVQLSEITVPPQKYRRDESYSRSREHVFGLPAGLEKTAYTGAAGHLSSDSSERHVQIVDLPPPPKSSGSLAPPTPPPHRDNSMARRQFSFQNVFRRHHPESQQQEQQQDQHHQHQRHLSSTSTATARHGLRSRGYSDRQVPRGDNSATEEERLGLVKGDSQSMPALPRYDDDESSEGEETTTSSSGISDIRTEDSDEYAENKRLHFRGREVTDKPPGPGRGRDGHDPSPGHGGSRGGAYA